MVSPASSDGLKKVKAIACWPLPSTFSAKALVSLMSGCACESVFTPTTTSGGSKATCVTQFTVAAATRPPLLSAAVRTYRPYGIIRSAVFFALASISNPLADAATLDVVVDVALRLVAPGIAGDEDADLLRLHEHGHRAIGIARRRVGGRQHAGLHVRLERVRGRSHLQRVRLRLTRGDRHVLVQVAAQIALRPAVLGDHARDRRAEHQQRLPARVFHADRRPVRARAAEYLGQDARV